jgi:hypothetical protein
MRALKRFIVWFAETLSELVLIVGIAAIVSGDHEQITMPGLRVLLFGALLLLVGSGYVLTAGVIATFFRSAISWRYPLVAAALFLIQVQLLVDGWTLPHGVQGRVLLIGAGVVFACSFVGGIVLRQWTADA